MQPETPSARVRFTTWHPSESRVWEYRGVQQNYAQGFFQTSQPSSPCKRKGGNKGGSGHLRCASRTCSKSRGTSSSALGSWSVAKTIFQADVPGESAVEPKSPSHEVEPGQRQTAKPQRGNRNSTAYVCSPGLARTHSKPQFRIKPPKLARSSRQPEALAPCARPHLNSTEGVVGNSKGLTGAVSGQQQRAG